MCGIFGGISVKDPVSILNVMGDTLKHRGPDDNGFFIDRNVALGHRRLSIIDLVSGHQPMLSPDKQQAVVYNGQIYNFKEIKEELIKKGHIFNTVSDTEVIINAYREWGYECLNRFNGMFAFALWDSASRKIWLVRDRIGKKPLYFIKLGNSFYFASEAKALWRLPGFTAEFDFRAIDQYLAFRYVPGNRTFYKGITKLPAGHWMLVDEDANTCQLKQWWNIPQKRNEAAFNKSAVMQDYYEEFHNIFSSAVKLRLVADVPLGLFLSSGIDSSSIAIEMAKVSRPTFITVGFGEKTDEIETARLLAKKVNAQHHSFLMKQEDFGLFTQAISSMDEPYGDAIILPTFLLARYASQKVKVILTGDGADEALGGYIHHDFFRRVPKDFPGYYYKILAALLGILPPAALNFLFHYPASLGKPGKERLCGLFYSYPDIFYSYLNFASLFTKRDRDALYSGDFKIGLKGEADEIAVEMRSHFNRTDIGPFDKALQWDMRTWFPEQTLMKLDRLAMANSIEGRCPYADYRLIEFLLKTPFEFFRGLSGNKNIIRSFYQQDAGFLPKKKQAFYLPLDTIFNRKAENLIKDVLSNNNLKQTGWFNRGYIEGLLRKRKESSLLADKQLMCLVILMLWLDSRKKTNTFN